MRSVLRVVASMVVANAAVAYGADAKSAVQTLKQGANATATDAKTKASELAKGTESKAKDVKATATEAVKDATKKADASQTTAPAAQPAAAPVSAETVKEAAKEAKEAVAAQGDTSGLAGERKSLIIPESAVLPESVLRFRAVYAGAESRKGYDGAGNKIESGIEVHVNAATAVLEYGITDRISAQFLVPYRLNGKAEVEKDSDFAKTGVKDLIKLKIKEVKNKLGAAYTGNVTTPVAIPLVAGLSIPAGAPVKTYVDGLEQQLLSAPAVPANLVDFAKSEVAKQTFTKGVGDIEIGAKYALSTVKEPWFDGIPFYTSVAAGVRLNSSKYSESTKKGERPVGRGTTDAAIRLNADYEFIDGVQLQLENQTEVMVAKGKAWNFSEASAGKELDLERKGMRQLGYSKLVVAPGTWIPAVDFLMMSARYGWNNESTTKLGSEETAGGVGRSTQLGVSFDGLKLKLPVQLDYDYVLASRGRSIENAFDAHVATLKLFYKF